MQDSERPLDPKDEKRLKTRGLGDGRDYQPFIKVHEISSNGESFRILGRNACRGHHLLSRMELSAFLFFDRNQQTIDIKEQYPVPIEDSLAICKRLGIKHLQLFGKLKVVTTDLVIVQKNKPGLAVAVKASEKLNDLEIVQKLQIEKVFWEQQGYQWKLFTEHEITAEIKENLEWLHATDQNLNELYAELSVEDIKLVFLRLRGISKRLSSTCSRLDDEYSCIPGFHIGVIRNGVALNVIDAPLDKVFKYWVCSDLYLIDTLNLIEGGLLDVS